ncbi:MAG: hypothetical protein ACOC9P_02285 [bacterium]
MGYPNVSFRREDKTVCANVDVPGLPQTVVFQFIGHSPNHAELLARHLCSELSEQMERMKREAYNAGWNDKAKKRRKRTHFCGDMDHDPKTM